MASASAGRKGRRYRRARKQVFDDWGDTCHICWHPGSRSVHHIPPRRVLLELGMDPDDPTWMRPAHGVEGCPWCPAVDGQPRRCNQAVGDRMTAGRVHRSAPFPW